MVKGTLSPRGRGVRTQVWLCSLVGSLDQSLPPYIHAFLLPMLFSSLTCLAPPLLPAELCHGLVCSVHLMHLQGGDGGAGRRETVCQAIS